MSTPRTPYLAQLLTRTLFWKSVIVVVTLAAIAWGLARQSGDIMQLLIDQEDRLRNLQRDSPISFFAAGFACYFATCFIPGTNGKTFVVGWLYGAVMGTLLINCSSTLAAFAMFYVTRLLLLDHVQSRYAGHLISINQNIQHDGGRYLFALRIISLVPFSVLNTLMGVTPLRASTFWWATQLGMLPSNIAFAWVGANLPNLRALHENGWTELLSWELFGALMLLGSLPFVARTLMRPAA